MSLTPAFLEELRMRTSLSALIGKTIKVQKAGREFKACCPFHNEKTPSFTINDEKGFYHCFGCGAHGDAIRWMTDQRGLPFMEAVKELAATAGMDVPAPDPRAQRQAEKARGLHDVMAAAQSFFEDQLGGIDGAEARAYLKKRGIGDATRRTFGFGFAPDSRGKLKVALGDFGEPMLVEGGLLIDPDALDGGAHQAKAATAKKRDSYDRFRGRLMLPIRDVRGRVIAFGGRIIGTGEPKYLNSPDTPLFDKGRTLYNLDRAAAAARRQERVIVVEGYMDVIALSQAGFEEAVAPLGTALTEHQIARLWTLSPVPILCFDGDAAGQKAAMRAAMRALPMLKPGHSLAFATLPAGQDPDDLVRARGPAAFAALLEAAEPLVERLWSATLAEAPVTTPEQRAGFKQRLRAISDAIADPDVRGHYVQLFRERHDALFFSRAQPSNMVRRQAQPQRGRSGARQPFIPERPLTQEARTIFATGLAGTLLRGVLAGLLCHPGEIRAHVEELSALVIADSGLSRLLAELLHVAWREETVETHGLLTILGDGELYNMARGLLRADALTFTFTRKSADPARARRDLAEAIRVMVAGPEIDAALAEATRAMGDTLDDASYLRQQTLRAAQADHLRRIAELMAPEDMI